MDFIARLPNQLDQAMTLFQLRRLGATGEFSHAANASDIQLQGTVPDERFDALAEAFQTYKGALHTEDRHIALLGGSREEHDSIEAAEEHLGGPYTHPGTTRATWAYGGDAADHIVQVLYLHEDHMGVKELQERTGRRAEVVMKAVKLLVEDGTVRRFRKPGDTSPSGEEYGLARVIRDKIDAVLHRAQVAESA